MDNYGTVDNPA